MIRMKIGNHTVLLLIVLQTGCIAMRSDNAVSSLPSQNNVEQKVNQQKRIPPRIGRWLAKSKIEFNQIEDHPGVYRLTLESPDLMTADQRTYIQEYFRGRAAESFAKVTLLDSNRVAVAVLSEDIESNCYRGVAAACGVDDITLSYNPDTRKGTLAMKIRKGDFSGTRELIRKHIEEIVRDKNIQLATGVPPPPGQYYLLDESVKDGNVLEVKFKTE